MKNRMKTILWLLAVYLVSCFLIASLAFCQEMPKPGTVIDKNNYKTYAHLLLPEFSPAFEDGFGGLMEPAKITVVESRPDKAPKRFVALSEKNRGKYGVDKEGLITGGYDEVGLPFPDLKKDDKDYALKLMWNFKFRYLPEDGNTFGHTYMKRKGEPARLFEAWMPSIQYINRLYLDPKPTYPTPVGLRNSGMFHYVTPGSIKNTITMPYQYMDLSRNDEVYIYLPALRRVIRGEAGQRSAPMTGSLQSLDDAYGFDGRIPDFTYKVVGEQKILVCFDSKLTGASLMGISSPKVMPFPSDKYEVRDVYVVDITPKNPRYPQSKKRQYIDMETLSPYHTIAWDRAGKLWKVWMQDYMRGQTPDKGVVYVDQGQLGIDVQFGMIMTLFWQPKLYTGLKYEDFTVPALLKRGM